MPEVEWMVAMAVIAAAAGVFRGFAGFGSGLLMAPVVTVFIEPRIAVPAMLMLSLCASARLVPEVWGEWNRRRVAMLAIPAMLTIPLGEMLLLVLSAAVVQQIIAVIVLVLVAVMASGWRYEGELRWPVVVPAGLISGALSGLGGVGGPPVVLVNMADSDADQARANLIVFFVVSQVTAVTGFVVGGVVEAQTLWYAGTSVIPFVIAIHFGAKLFRPERARAWRNVSLGILAAAAFVALVVEPLH